MKLRRERVVIGRVEGLKLRHELFVGAIEVEDIDLLRHDHNVVDLILLPLGCSTSVYHARREIDESFDHETATQSSTLNK